MSFKLSRGRNWSPHLESKRPRTWPQVFWPETYDHPSSHWCPSRMNSGLKITPVLLARVEETCGSHSHPYHGSARRRKLYLWFHFLTYKLETRIPASLTSYPKASWDQGRRVLCRGRQITAMPSTAIPVHLIYVASRTPLPGVHLTDLDVTAKPPAWSQVGRALKRWSFPSLPAVSPSLSILSASSLFEAFSSALGQLENTRTQWPASSGNWRLDDNDRCSFLPLNCCLWQSWSQLFS